MAKGMAVIGFGFILICFNTRLLSHRSRSGLARVKSPPRLHDPEYVRHLEGYSRETFHAMNTMPTRFRRGSEWCGAAGNVSLLHLFSSHSSSFTPGKVSISAILNVPQQCCTTNAAVLLRATITEVMVPSTERNYHT